MRTFKYLIAALLATTCSATFTACNSDAKDDEPDTPTSTLTVRINDVIVSANDEYMEELPHSYIPYLTIDNLPEDEKILEAKAFFSYTNTEPDSLDLLWDFSTTAIDMVNNSWNFEEEGPFIWSVSDYITMFLPGRTYYVRARVTTNRGVYYTNTKEFDVEEKASLTDDADTRHIPIVFHIFPSADGTYVDKAILLNQLEYANLVFANAWQLPDDCAADTKIRFDLATTDDAGNELEEPGFVYENGYFELQSANTDQPICLPEDFDLTNYMWNPKKEINIFVCDFNSEMGLGGLTSLPFFDQAELMPLCDTYPPKHLSSCAVYLNNLAIRYIYGEYVLAHELGHYLGLHHLFVTDENNDYCDDTPFYDRDTYLEDIDNYYIYRLLYGTENTYIVSTNIMDDYYSFFCAITSDQKKRMDYTLQYAYNVPSPYGKEPELSWEEIKTSATKAKPLSNKTLQK